jgi:hypothetical protein
MNSRKVGSQALHYAVSESHHASIRVPNRVSHFEGSPTGASTSNHTRPGCRPACSQPSGCLAAPMSSIASDMGLAGRAEDLATSGLTVRCLQLSDGSLPETDHDAGALAYVARAY